MNNYSPTASEEGRIIERIRESLIRNHGIIEAVSFELFMSEGEIHKELEKAYGIIYLAINKKTFKTYIGQTTKALHYRAKYHVYNAKYKNNIFPKAIIKYGQEGFIWRILDIADNYVELNRLEKFWIQTYRSVDRQFGYNVKSGGAQDPSLIKPTNYSWEEIHGIEKATKLKEEYSKRFKNSTRPEAIKKQIAETAKKSGVGKWMKGKRRSLESIAKQLETRRKKKEQQNAK